MPLRGILGRPWGKELVKNLREMFESAYCERVRGFLRVAILYFGGIRRASGTSERVLQIATELASQGVHVILSGDVLRRREDLKHANLQIIVMPSRILKLLRVFRWGAQLIASALTHKYDIVQIESFSLPRSLALFLLLRPFSRKFIIVFHDKRFEYLQRSFSGKLLLAFQRVLLILFDAAITPGLSVKKWFMGIHGEIARRKMVVIPNGAPNLDIKDVNYLSLRKKYGVEQNVFTALFFGSMGFMPNYEAALRLYDMSEFICREFERITRRKLVFIVVGLRSKALPETEHFIPLGFIEKFDELLSLPDVIVLPHMSSYSGPHVKTIYAFLSRKPVVATEDAVKDMPCVVPQKHFSPFDVNEPNSLLSALMGVYQNRELQKSLATNAFQYAKNFSWRRISLLHLKLYECLLNEL